MSRSQRARNDEARIAREKEKRAGRRDSRHVLRTFEGPRHEDPSDEAVALMERRPTLGGGTLDDGVERS